MAAYLDKMQMNTAITDSTKFDLSHVHITTSNFMQLQPVYLKEMVPGEKLDVNVETFSRMNPLPVPTFGRANIKNRAYFVPFRTVFRGWSDFITDAPHQNSLFNPELLVSLQSSVPTVSNDVLIQAFTQYVYKSESGISDQAGLMNGDASSYDIVYNNEGLSYKKFTPVGRTVYKTLESLGYKINWNINDKTVYSALPLLAFAKVYCDWYFPSAYTNSVDYSYLMMLLNADSTNGITLNYEDVGKILQMSYVCYDSDYFTSAWDNPTQPGSGKTSDYRLINLDYAGGMYMAGTAYNSEVYSINPGSVVNNSGSLSQTTGISGTSAPFIRPTVTGKRSSDSVTVGVVTPISQYLLHGLHALTDYLKRHQMAGGRAFDRYLARYGKALPAEKLNRSIYLGSQMVPVQIGDVMSNSDTEGAVLGDYAGKGMAYGNGGDFSFKTDEFGMFVIVSSIVPATGYYQGIDRSLVKHVTRLDFFVPEFESLGTQPITADELYMSRDGGSNLSLMNASTNDSNIHETIFGFTPRYAEYKVARDYVTGNFRIPTLNGDTSTNNGAASWHLMRDFDDDDFRHRDASNNWLVSTDDMKHSLNFVYSRGDVGTYNRIFYNNTLNAPDNFTLIYNFSVGSYAPMKPLYDSYEFEDKGRKVTVEVNGVKHN